MSKSELDKYKKELKQEAAEQRRLKQEAWQAYKSKHIVHLGEGIYWSDDSSEDQWDTPNANKRLLANQLPVMINTHPQRWTDNKTEWILEYITQNVKNLIKKIIVNRMGK